MPRCRLHYSNAPLPVALQQCPAAGCITAMPRCRLPYSNAPLPVALQQCPTACCITAMLHTPLHVHAAILRRTSGRKLKTFQWSNRTILCFWCFLCILWVTCVHRFLTAADTDSPAEGRSGFLKHANKPAAHRSQQKKKKESKKERKKFLFLSSSK